MLMNRILNRPFVINSNFFIKHLSYIQNHIPTSKETFLKKLNYKNEKDFLQDIFPKNKPFTMNILNNSYEKTKHKLDYLGKQNSELNIFYGQGFYPSRPIEHLKQNFLTNPNFYSAYIPYQSEISQGRLELLYNYQTMICNLTNMDIANCSLLDESSACAEAMLSLYSFVHKTHKNPIVYIDSNCFDQHIEVLKTRAKSLGIEYEILDLQEYQKMFLPLKENSIAIFHFQNKYGEQVCLENTISNLKESNIKSIVVMDPLACTLYEPPGSYGADIVVGSTQRFGLPMWNGGPHAAFFAAKKEYIRYMPGRLVGKSIDIEGNKGYRLALQSREQHIKKDRALSNICTSQALLANYNVLYAMYLGPNNLREKAISINKKTTLLKNILDNISNKGTFEVINKSYFDTLTIQIKQKSRLFNELQFLNQGYLIKYEENSNQITISLDETKELQDIKCLLENVFYTISPSYKELEEEYYSIRYIPKTRVFPLLPQNIFNSYNNEHKITRYLTNIQKKDISLTHSMIPLGSCTMKLNSSEVLSSLFDEKWCNIHPYTPNEYQAGYTNLLLYMNKYLQEVTGLPFVSFQSSSGAMGEYSALCAIKKYFENNKQEQRNICIIPDSAHGTNFASAKLAGYKIKKIKSTKKGSLDITHLEDVLQKNNDNIGCAMITFPSTFGFFEDEFIQIIEKIKNTGAKIYCDGANMNSFMGIINLKEIGIDACHMNLHKTFTIPHGGGGPGMGPIAVTEELSTYLPSHSIVPIDIHKNSYGSIASAPHSSAALLTIPFSYISMCGSQGLQDCSIGALLAANYMKQQLQPHFKIPFTNKNNCVSHEFIIDVSEFKPISEKDISKRLMDYGFHAPTMSWPVSSSLMIEPTECEDIEELDRFISALIQIKKEILEIQKNGNFENNLLVNAPHSIDLLYKDEWNYDYSKEQAYFPLKYIKNNKFHIPVSRIDDAHGDRNLILKD